MGLLSLCLGFTGKPSTDRIKYMIQLQNFFLFLVFLVVLCGTSAPVLFQWWFSRDVSTGAPSSNGSIIPIPIASFTLIVYLHSRNLIRSMNGGGVLVRASRPVLFPSRRSSSEPRAIKAFFVCVSVLHFCLLQSLWDFSTLESFCGVLCLLFFCSLLHRSSARERRRKGPRGNEQRGKAGPGQRSKSAVRMRYSKASKPQRRVEVLAQHSPDDAYVEEPLGLPRRKQLTVAMAVAQKVPLSMTLAHGGVCVGILGVVLSNSKKLQFTQRMPLGSELNMGTERCSLRGIDHLHGPTSHSICGNLMIYKPSREGLIFDHGRNLEANGKLEHFMHWWTKKDGKEHWLSMFPEKRYFRERTSTAEVAIHTNLFTDLYALIGTGSASTGGWYTTIMKLPFIFLIWLGFLLASLGGLPSLFRLLQREKLRWN